LLFFFIQDKIFFLRKRFWLFVLFFAIGSLPLIHYNINHDFDTFMVARGIGLGRAIFNIPMLFRDVIPQLLGIRIPLYGDNWNTLSLPEYWGLILGAVYIITFLYIIITRWKNIPGFLTFSLKRIGPTEMLLAFIVISIFIFIRSERANNWAVRYILPIFSVVPVLLSLAIYEIGKRYKTVGGVILGIVLIIQLYGNGRVYAVWGIPEIVDKTLDLPDDRELVSFLDTKGITRAYAHYWISYRMTYETGERIICAQPYDERFAGRFKPRYIDEVASSENIAYILHDRLGVPPHEFEKSLKKIGGNYKKEVMKSFTVFYQFRPPFVEIPKEDWRVTSNYNPRDASLAIDGSIGTRWGSGHPRVKGMSFEIETPRAYLLSKIEIRLGRFTMDYPETIELEISEDRERWKNVVFTTHMEDILRWERGQPRYFFGHEAVILYYLFEPVMARFVRLIQTGSHPVFDWSIPEISLYSPAGG
ncbi:MAG: discoidin domain-containing protein, partial [Nitrospirae bacterium]|nr:discoidin domain-containing protein [Nitrospirota bacterium]